MHKNPKHSWLGYRPAFLRTGISGQCIQCMEPLQHGGQTNLYRVSSECIACAGRNGSDISRQNSLCGAIRRTQRDDRVEYVRTCLFHPLARVLTALQSPGRHPVILFSHEGRFIRSSKRFYHPAARYSLGRGIDGTRTTRSSTLGWKAWVSNVSLSGCHQRS